MTIRLYIDGTRAGRQLSTRLTREKVRVLKARRETAQDVVADVVPRARADIRRAGKFGPRWTEGFRGKVTEGGGFVRVSFTQAVPYWKVFQFGAVIRGKPMLWIPLSFATDAKGKSAKDFPGRLFRVNRRVGASLLMMAGRPAQPKYFGKTSVRIPKKFRTIEIIREGAAKMPAFFKKHMKEG